MTITTPSIGSIVRYEDRANPPTFFEIIGAADEWGSYRLRNIYSDEVTSSDLRQVGWSIAAESKRSPEAQEIVDLLHDVNNTLVMLGRDEYRQNGNTQRADRITRDLVRIIRLVEAITGEKL